MFGKNMMLLDAGNLYSLKRGGEQDREVGFIIEIMNQQDYDVIGLGPKDVMLPDSILKPMLQSTDFAWVGSNYQQGIAPKSVRDFYVRKVDGVKVGVFTWVDPSYSANSMDSSRVTDDLEEAVRRFRRKCDVLVMMAHTSNRQPEDLISRVPEVDIVLLGGVSNPWNTARRVGETYVGNSGDRGRHIARFELLLNREKRIVDSKYVLIKLDHDMPRDPEVAQMMEDFKDRQEQEKLREIEQHRQERLSELNLDERSLPWHDSDYRFVGERECRTCHREVQRAYKQTSHARAFSDLIRDRQSGDESKLRRCVTGYMVESGYLNRRDTPYLYNVQCEACHGPGSAHVDSKGGELQTLADPRETCFHCHSPEQDPDFDLESSLPLVHDVSALTNPNQSELQRSGLSSTQPRSTQRPRVTQPKKTH